jgi:membrane fusion protein, multidrug efflux system
MASKAIYTVVAVAGIAAASGLAWWYQNQNRDSGRGAVETPAPGPANGAVSGAANPTPPSVEVARVELAQLADDTRSVGSLRSRRGVVLRPEVSGRITQLNFTDGQRVRKGQLLVQFDDQLPQAQIQQSQAELSIAQANQKRNQELIAQNFISQRSADESAANLQVAQAKLALARATAARLKIVAPFDGIAGIRQVNVGDYLKDGADIVNIEDIDAIYVDFRLPERFQSKLRRGQTAVLDIDALPGQAYTGQIQAIDPLIDANGRSVGVRACVDNRALQLRPGMFARVTTLFGVRDKASVIPEEAVVPQGGKQFVIKLLKGPDDASRTTQRVEVTVGLRSPGRVEILQGLEVGDFVVRTGQQRLQKDGTVVTVVDLANNLSAGAQAQPVASGAAPQATVFPAAAKAAVAVPRQSGANPCGVAVSQMLSSGLVPTGNTVTPERSPVGPALRNPG